MSKPTTDKLSLGSLMQSLNAGEEFDAYSKVIIYAGSNEHGETVKYEAGDNTGAVLEIENEWGTQQMANNILAQIKGWQYQPYEAENSFLDPIAELGDAITAGAIYSGIYNRSITFGKTLFTNVSAPHEEETIHEYGYDTSKDRKYERHLQEQRALLSINESQIAAEVTRASQAEGTLGSRITQTATDITAEVTRASQAEGNLSTRITTNANGISAEITRASTAEGNLSTKITANTNSISAEVTRATTAEGKLSTSITANASSITAEVKRAKDAEGTLSSKITQTESSINATVANKLDTKNSSTSFGWELTASSWKVKSNNSTVLEATKDGISVTGAITAKSGYIGNGSSGFTISSSSIYNGVNSMSSTSTSGVYVGTDGIKLGGNFSVTKAGSLTAKSGYIGNGSSGFTISASAIYNGISSYGGTGTNGVYIGTNGIQLGQNFSVSSGGALTAKSGYIGNGSSGFTISSNAIYNGLNSLTASGSSGVYIGTSGIRLGEGFKVTSSGSMQIGSNFSVSSSGNITATGGTFTGTLKCDALYVKNSSGGYDTITTSTMQYALGGGSGYAGRSATYNSLANAAEGSSYISNFYMSNAFIQTLKMQDVNGTIRDCPTLDSIWNAIKGRAHLSWSNIDSKPSIPPEATITGIGLKPHAITVVTGVNFTTRTTTTQTINYYNNKAIY